MEYQLKNYSNLLGIPYKEKDCWGIVVDFYRLVFNSELNRYYEAIPENRVEAKNLIYSSMGDFTKVDSEDKKFGDILLIKIFGVESHIAVYLGEGRILHTTSHSGCVIDRVDRWKHLIVGYYRVIKDDTTS